MIPPFQNKHLPEQVFQEILPVFIEETEKNIHRIRTAYEREDQALIKRHAHTLKGGSLSYGAQALSEICGALEAGADGRLLALESLVDQLDEAFAKILVHAREAYSLEYQLKTNTNATPRFDHILLVDDDPAVCAFNKALLQSIFPHSTITAFHEAQAALEHLAGPNFQKDSTLPILLLVDFYMPELDGFEFMAEVEELEEEITDQLSIFLLTLHDHVRTHEMVKKFPLIKALLKKPLEAKVLLDALGRA